MEKLKISPRILIGLLAIAGLGLFSGLYAGMVRLGFLPAVSHAISPMAHGPLMINGFLGTLIGLERAAALEKRWAFAAPMLMGGATLSLLLNRPDVATLLVVPGSLALTFIMGYLYYLQSTAYHLIMALGAASLLVGNALYYFQFPIFELVGWWIGFPMLTIFGERLELNRIMRPPKRARHIFLISIMVWLAAVAITHNMRTIGWMIASVMLIFQAIWLMKYDIARRTIHSVEWTRYSAISLLSGYVWLVIAGLWGIAFGFPTAGMKYDGLLHLIFVGFVFSMIFAHAAVIIPSLSGKLVPYHPYFYLPLVLLHGFLIVRVLGDLAGMNGIRLIASYGNVAAILLFLGGIVVQLIKDAAE